VNNAKSHPYPEWLFIVIVLWRLPTLPGLTQVSSAVPGLTSLFGMGRGEHRANSHQQDFLLVNCDFGMEKGEANRRTVQANSHQQDLCECIINVILEAKENEVKVMQAVG
jgi:hypothetical protein